MKITRHLGPAGSDSRSREITFTTLPSASTMQPGSLGSCLMRSHSRYPLGLSASAVRSPSERGFIPPATSICIIKQVPELRQAGDDRDHEGCYRTSRSKE